MTIHKLGMLRWLWVTVVMFCLDQLTKQLMFANLEWQTVIPIMPMLNWYVTGNTGAAFSFLSDADGWQRWFFTVVALVISVFLLAWMRKLKPDESWTAVGLAFILSGAFGNVVDRIIYGYVIDFIQFYYPAQGCLPGFSQYPLFGEMSCVWPAFNVADSAISIGAAILILEMLRDMRRTRKDKVDDQVK